MSVAPTSPQVEEKPLSLEQNIAIIIGQLDPEKTYYHCITGGEIFEDPEYTIPTSIDLIEMTGSPQIPEELKGYNIISGYCEIHKPDQDSIRRDNYLGRPEGAPIFD